MHSYRCLAGILLLILAACGDDTSGADALSRSNNDTRTEPNNGKEDTPGPGDAGQNDPGDAGMLPEDTGWDPPAPVYDLTAEPYTTLQKIWAPRILSEDAKTAIRTNALPITAIDRYEQYGIGVEAVAGQPWVENNELAPGFGRAFEEGTRPERKSLLYFRQSADPQIIDEESPIRLAATLVPVGSAYRPQSHLVTQVFESHVRTARRISELSGREFDFAFIAGDMTDGGQENELAWTATILGGGVVDPDSGIDDDPVPGPANDFTDPYYSAGIGVPWYPALGNHETLYMGTFEVNDAIQQGAIGDEVVDFTDQLPLIEGLPTLFNGFRDASTLTAEVRSSGKTPADARRRILDTPDVVSALFHAPGEPAGHGFTQADVDSGKAYYSFHPIPGKPIRFVVLNTVMRKLSVANVQGGMERDQFRWLEDQLIEAQLAGELVIVGSHHRTGAMSLGSSVSKRELERLLGAYENVVAHVVGHDHHSGRFLKKPFDNKRGYWELMAPSTVDFPLQSRIAEIVYEGHGYISIYLTNMGHNAPEDSLSHYARHLAAGRRVFMSQNYPEGWLEERSGDNVIVRMSLPDDVRGKIENTDWPTRIESEETLLTLGQ